MNIRGLLADCLRQHAVDQSNDRCIVFSFEQIGRLRQLGGEAIKIHLLAHTLGHPTRAGVAGLVEPCDALAVFGLFESLDDAFTIEIAPDLAQRLQVGRSAQQQLVATRCIATGNGNAATSGKSEAGAELSAHPWS